MISLLYWLIGLFLLRVKWHLDFWTFVYETVSSFPDSVVPYRCPSVLNFNVICLGENFFSFIVLSIRYISQFCVSKLLVLWNILGGIFDNLLLHFIFYLCLNKCSDIEISWNYFFFFFISNLFFTQSSCFLLIIASGNYLCFYHLAIGVFISEIFMHL